MRFENEFTVNAPVERAWDTLLELERVAGFLPGASIESSEDAGVYHGVMRLKVGPMVVQYRGTARLVEVNEAERVAEVALEARETKGQGTAVATIRNHVLSDSSGTRVIVETDMKVTGRQAQFGRGVMQEVAERLLADFARRLEQYLADDAASGTHGIATGGAVPGGNRTAPSRGAPAGPLSTTANGADGLDVVSLMLRTRSVQRVGAALAATTLAILMVRRRRRS